ncbi:hypothetical protein [Clostridium sp. ZBS15]|uniref:hypothetical protein n=1 Tax=Clostridium sp. ZBS15 TaxID=2949969 RepID=UPI00207AB6E0|nr:hypothetical protein [Clostridium sp. ZBS15]
MFIRLFVYANNEINAKEISENIISNIESFIVEKKYIKIETYWKIEQIYIIELSIELNKEINTEAWINFLKRISDKWEFYGDPIDEILISESLNGCDYIRKDISMINIFL